MSTGAAALLHAWHWVATLMVIRSLPVVIFLLVTSQTNLRQKISVLAGAAFLAFATRGWTLIPWTWFGLSYLYLIGVGCLVPMAARRLQSGRLSRGGAFVLCLSGFLVLPGLLWPPAMKLVALVIAWDIVLSSYSYCVEITRSGEQPSRADCLFFLFVNPALVYSQRGTRTGSPAFEPTGLFRILVAILIFFLTALLLVPFFQLMKQKTMAGSWSGLADADLVLCGSIGFVIQYAQASALASLQIGLLRQTGHQIPERYDWPIRAKTLPEFWRRWNTYVSQWTLHYLFWPLSIELGRRFRGRRQRVLITIAGLIAAFVAVGILHDAYASLLVLTVQSRLTLFFFVNGVLAIVWMGVQRIGQAARDRDRLPRWLALFASGLSRVCLWCFVSVCAVWWLRI